jgi:hypothetical protein
MSTFLGVRKVSGGAWNAAEKDAMIRAWQQAEKKLLQKKRKDGIELKNIAVPLPDKASLKRYKADTKLKKELEPFQVINPYRLKKHYEA